MIGITRRSAFAMRVLAAGLTLTGLASANVAQATSMPPRDPRVVVTIKPLHALVAWSWPGSAGRSC